MSFWFFMCLSNEGHIRVSTLQNHLKQNNAFCKCFLPETHLPAWQALSLWKRSLRLLSYLLVLLSTSAFVSMIGLANLESKIVARQICHKNCQLSHFPSISACKSEPDLVRIRHGNNLYTNFFRYDKPETKTGNVQEVNDVLFASGSSSSTSSGSSSAISSVIDASSNSASENTDYSFNATTVAGTTSTSYYANGTYLDENGTWGVYMSNYSSSGSKITGDASSSVVETSSSDLRFQQTLTSSYSSSMEDFDHCLKLTLKDDWVLVYFEFGLIFFS